MQGWLLTLARALDSSVDEVSRLTVREAGELLRGRAKAAAGQGPKAPAGSQKVSLDEMARLLGGGSK